MKLTEQEQKSLNRAKGRASQWAKGPIPSVVRVLLWDIADLVKLIDRLAQEPEVVHARWIPFPIDTHPFAIRKQLYHCSECHSVSEPTTQYCHFCGANMDADAPERAEGRSV